MMLLEVGPFEAQQVRAWSKCLRRLVIELRLCPEGSGPFVDDDVLTQWSQLADAWASTDFGTSACVRWEDNMEPDKAEFLLHGLLTCLSSEFLRRSLTDEELQSHTPFTLHVIQSFVDALNSDGHCDRNYIEQVRSGITMYSARAAS
jgi:hypothetical protein